MESRFLNAECFIAQMMCMNRNTHVSHSNVTCTLETAHVRSSMDAKSLRTNKATVFD
jgi:hypothetical protein